MRRTTTTVGIAATMYTAALMFNFGAGKWCRGDYSGWLEKKIDHYRVPFVSNRLGAEPRSFFGVPFCACGYQNRACYGTRGLRIFDYRQLEYLSS